MQPADLQAELIRQHRTTALTVRALLLLIVLLSLVAFIARNHFWHDETQYFESALKIAILIFGLGSVILRRTMFAATRLQDLTALKGVSGLLSTLRATTLLVALLGATMAIFGFVGTVKTGNDFYSYGSGLVGLVVLLHSYPSRRSWEQAVQRFAPLETEKRTQNTLLASE